MSITELAGYSLVTAGATLLLNWGVEWLFDFVMDRVNANSRRDMVEPGD